MSPAAKMPGTEDSRRELHRTPPFSPIFRPALLASETSGVTPAPIDDRVRLQREAAAGDDALDTAVALEALELVLAVDLDPVFREQPLEEAPGGLAEAAFERDLLLHHDRAALAEHRQRGRDLAADVGAADQHHPLSVGDALADVSELPRVRR